MLKETKISNFIEKALKESKGGELRKQLEIPKGKKIPFSLLNEIIAAKAGETILNPTKTGKRVITVTRKLERRAILAKTLKKISMDKRY